MAEEQQEAPRPGALRIAASVAVGMTLGLLYMGAMAASNWQRIGRQPEAVTGMERLAAGATEWQPLQSPDGQHVTHLWRSGERLLVSTSTRPHGSALRDGRWETTTELPPAPTAHAPVPDGLWRRLPGGRFLTTRAGSCAPVLEPEMTTLPALPRCDPEKFPFKLTEATTLSGGDLLVVVLHLDDTTHAWRWPAGAAAWIDTGELPLHAVAVEEVVPGFRDDALAYAIDGAMVRYDGQRWTSLPRPRSERLGWQAALAEDGAVLAGGGSVDTTRKDELGGWLIFLPFLAAAVLLWRALGLQPVALGCGGCASVVLAILLFFVAIVLLGGGV